MYSTNVIHLAEVCMFCHPQMCVLITPFLFKPLFSRSLFDRSLSLPFPHCSHPNLLFHSQPCVHSQSPGPFGQHAWLLAYIFIPQAVEVYVSLPL